MEPPFLDKYHIGLCVSAVNCNSWIKYAETYYKCHPIGKYILRY